MQSDKKYIFLIWFWFEFDHSLIIFNFIQISCQWWTSKMNNFTATIPLMTILKWCWETPKDKPINLLTASTFIMKDCQKNQKIKLQTTKRWRRKFKVTYRLNNPNSRFSQLKRNLKTFLYQRRANRIFWIKKESLTRRLKNNK